MARRFTVIDREQKMGTDLFISVISDSRSSVRLTVVYRQPILVSAKTACKARGDSAIPAVLVLCSFHQQQGSLTDREEGERGADFLLVFAGACRSR